MGIVRRQSIQNTILSYGGAFIGFVTVGVIFPNFLSTSENGLIKIIAAFGMIMAQLAMFGTNVSTFRIFPYFKDKSTKHHGYLAIPVIVSLIGFVLVSVLFLIFREPLLSNKANDSHLLNQYYWLIIPYMFFYIYFALLDSYSVVLLKTVRGILYKELVQRVLILLIALLFAYKIFHFEIFINLYIYVTAVPPIAMFIMLLVEKEIPFKSYLKRIKKDVYKHFIDISLFAIIGGFSSIAIPNIDSIMLNKLTTLSLTGIYAVMYYFGSIIMMPSRSMNRVAAGLVTQYWKDNDLENIKKIYVKTSITQLIVGIWIFMGVWCNMHNIFHLIPTVYQSGLYVVFFIGLGSVINMFFGCNTQILAYSKYYRYDTYLIFFLVFITIVLNLIFIPIYGINGAAIASALSILFYNFFRFLFIWIKFKIQPFNYKNLICIIVGILCILLGMYLPKIHQFIIDFIYRSIIITIIYGVLVYKLNLSEDVNQFVKIALAKLSLKR